MIFRVTGDGANRAGSNLRKCSVRLQLCDTVHQAMVPDIHEESEMVEEIRSEDRFLHGGDTEFPFKGSAKAKVNIKEFGLVHIDS